MKKIKSCFSFLAGMGLLSLGALLLIGAFLPEGMRSKMPFSDQIHRRGIFGNNAKHSPLAPARVWTAKDGRTLTGIPISSDETAALIRVVSADRLYSIPISRLSEKDAKFLATFSNRQAEMSEYPPFPSVWPRTIDTRDRPITFKGKTAKREFLKESEKAWSSYQYQGLWSHPHHIETPHFRIHTQRLLDYEVAESLTAICEAIHTAVRSVPLPLLWRGPEASRRDIYIHSSQSSYALVGGSKGMAGFYQPATGKVHILESELVTIDINVLIGRMKLAKRQHYRTLTHELIHQATIGIGLGDAPAWMLEGIAEFFAATQTSPGRFDFTNNGRAIKQYLDQKLGGDGVVQIKALRVEKLETFLTKSLEDYNQTTLSGEEGQGFLQYANALILTDYFCFAEPNALKYCLQAIVTGVEASRAIETHLLRGRTHSDIERLIRDRASKSGLDLEFTDTPEVTGDHLRHEVGFDTRL